MMGERSRLRHSQSEVVDLSRWILEVDPLDSKASLVRFGSTILLGMLE